MASPPTPYPPTGPWLHLASRLGRVAIVCRIVENVLLLLAPLAFLLSLPNARLMVTGSILLVFTDAGFLLRAASPRQNRASPGSSPGSGASHERGPRARGSRRTG